MFATKTYRALRYVLLLTMMHVLSVQIYAEHFKTVDMPDGLSGNTVKCIVQDKFGFIWFGTNYGLCRYDGRQIAVYRHQQNTAYSVVSNNITSLKSAANGIWVGTFSGLDFFSYTSNQFIHCLRTDSKKVIGRVKDIVSVGNNLYVTNFAGELFVRQRGTYFRKLHFNMTTTGWYGISPYVGHLLLALADNGVYVLDPFNGKVVSRYVTKMLTPSNAMCYNADNGVLYIGLGLGFPTNMYKLDAFHRISPFIGKAPRNVNAIINFNGKTIFGTDGQGLFYENEGKEMRWTHQNSDLSSNVICSFLKDRDNNLWIGTHLGGLSLYSKSYNWFENLLFKDSQLSSNLVSSVFVVGDNVYMGTDGAGLLVYNRLSKTYSLFNTSNSQLPGNNILSLYEDNGDLWMCIYGYGLCKMSLRSRQVTSYYSLPGGLDTKHDTQIKKDRLGRIWMMGEMNAIFEPKSNRFFRIPILKGITATSIDFDGNVAWVCTNNGLYKIDLNSMRLLVHYTTSSSRNRLTTNSLYHVFIDSKHRVWFSSEYSGLFVLDQHDGSIRSFGNKDGLTDQTISSIEEDSKGSLWMSSFNGLFRFNPVSQTFIRFGKEDNLVPFRYYCNSSFSDKDDMYFGSTNGLVMFHPSNINYNSRSVSVYLTGIELISGYHNGNMIDLSISSPQPIKLQHDENFFTIHFSVPELLAGAKILFKCYLKGLDKGWREVYHDRQVSYTNVPPGKYEIYIMSTNGQAQWSNKVTVAQIIVLPPWYRTTWAWILWYALFGAFLYAVFYFVRHEIHIKQVVRLKEMEEQSVKMINEAKLNFLTNITHELRTPIFLITAPLEELLASGKNIIQTPKSYISAIYRNAMRLTKLMSRIIDFRKLESGMLTLDCQRQNVVSFCKDLTVDYEALCLQKGIVFVFQPGSTVIQLDFDPEKLESIISNIISNAFKYTPEGGKIIFSIDENETEVLFAIKDNGIGIDKQYHESIFQNFFQVDPTKTTYAGDGIGLSFVKRLIELHGGHIHLDSELNKGTKFFFELPKLAADDDGKAISSPIIDDIQQVKRPDGLLPQSPVAGQTILIIDDEKEAVEVIERTLVSDFRVIKAYNGLDGYNMMKEQLPDLVICDLMMPIMNGTEFLCLVKKDKKLAHIPVIVFTAKTSEDDMLSAFESGADAYLTKPVSMKILRKRIDNLLAQVESVEITNVISKSDKNYTKEEQRFLLRCREIIDDNLSNADFNLDFFSKKLGMSHSSLYKKIKVVTGLTAIEFINEYRIFKAIKFMNEGETNIGTISVKCGFNDIRTFREAFKKRMKLTPRDYLQQM